MADPSQGEVTEKEQWARAHPDNMTREEYSDALRDAREELFSGKEPQSKPKAIILAGQPGSGKSLLAQKAQDELNAKGGGVVIDVDELRKFHPRYTQLAKQDYETAATRVQPDASQLSKDLRAEATNGHYNLIIDGTLNNPAKAEKMARELKAAGYEVDIRAMAVPKAISEQGVAGRLENALADPNGRAIPRIVEPSVQKEAYEGLPSALEHIEKLGVADRVEVYERGSSTPIYDSSNPTTADGNASRTLVAARERELTPEQKSDLARNWDQISQQAEARHAPQQTLDEYQAERAAAHSQLRADPKASAVYDTTAPTPRSATTPVQTPATSVAGASVEKTVTTTQPPLVVEPTRANTIDMTTTTPQATAPVGVEKYNKVNGRIGVASIGLNVVDAFAKGDIKTGVETVGAAAAIEGGTKVVGRVLGAEAVPVVGQAAGMVFAGMDAYDAARKGNYAHAAVSGTEAALYGVAGAATVATVADAWNPTVVAPGTVAVVAGAAALTLTTARTIYDSARTIRSWFESDADKRMEAQREAMKSIDEKLPKTTDGVTDPITKQLIEQRQQIDALRAQAENAPTGRSRMQILGRSNAMEEQRTKAFFDEVYKQRAEQTREFDSKLPTGDGEIKDPKLKALADEKKAIEAAQKLADETHAGMRSGPDNAHTRAVAKAQELRLQHMDNVTAYMKENPSTPLAKTDAGAPKAEVAATTAPQEHDMPTTMPLPTASHRPPYRRAMQTDATAIDKKPDDAQQPAAAPILQNNTGSPPVRQPQRQAAMLSP